MELMSAQINELATYLCKAQSEILSAKKDSQNPFFQSNYADLESVWDACRGPLTRNGLAVSQFVVDDKLATMLTHTSGQWIRGYQKIHSKDNSPQATGSAITYARRYGLAAIVGIVQTDDDGESAEGRQPVSTKSQDVQAKIESKPQPQNDPYAHMDAPLLPGEAIDHPLASYPFPVVAKKYLGKTLGQVPPGELAGYVSYMSKFLTREGKPISGKWKELLENIDEYLGAKV